MISELKI